MLFVISSCDGMTPGIYSAPPLGIIVHRMPSNDRDGRDGTTQDTE